MAEFVPPAEVLAMLHPGCKLRFEVSGSPISVYADSGMTLEHAQPLELDRFGRLPGIYLDDSAPVRVYLDNLYSVARYDFIYPVAPLIQPLQSAAFDASAPRNYLKRTVYPVDTSTSAVTATLSGDWESGDQISFADESGSFAANGLTVDFGTHNFRGVASATRSYSIKDQFPTLMYVDATYGFGEVGT